ncbi:MAG: hypothetical protein WKF96_12640 [Solirubrobacteraceae bacterium]
MSDCWRGFDVAVRRWRLGELMAERLPAVALSALSAGCDTPSLGQLAAMDDAGWSEVEALVARVLEERGRAVASAEEALMCVADDVVRRMVDGEVAPEEATARLRRLSMKALDDPAWKDLGAFNHLALDWEVAEDACEAGLRGADLDALRAEMLREGRDLMARGGVRLA